MNLSLVSLYVRDMEKSLAFFNNLLEIPILRRQPIGAGKELIFLGAAGTANLELVPSDEDVAYAGFNLGFEVEDLVAVKKRLAEHGYPIDHEMKPNPSTTLCFLKGPNGERVELIAHQ